MSGCDLILDSAYPYRKDAAASWARVDEGSSRDGREGAMYTQTADYNLDQCVLSHDDHANAPS